VGLGSALALKAFGCKEISIAETNQLRCETAEQEGIEFVFDPTKENNLTDGSMDVIIDAVGSKESRRTAIQSPKLGSVIVHVDLLDGLTDLMQEGLPSRKSPLWAFIPTP